MAHANEPVRSSDPLIGASIGGRYVLTRQLGAGAMGAVYQAFDAEGAPRALKIMHREAADRSAAAVTRFINEARATASLQSPHIVAVLDGGIDEVLRLPYLVMELLQGYDADALLGRVGALDPTAAVRIAIQAAQGLAAAHAAGIVHRDIKPSNLFLEARPDGSYVVKICDFGIAKISDPEAQITRTGAMLGSPLYMSPEQAKSSKHVDARADVWSLGVTLYRLLCATTPHESSQSFAELLTAIATTDAPNLQERAPWVEPGLAAIVHAALLRNPDARWPSIAKFSRALFAFSHNDTRLPAEILTGVSPELRAYSAPRASLPAAAPRSIRPAAPEGDRLLGTTLAGRYRLDRELGRGGMGAVYEATGADGRRYAVKVVLDEASQSSDAMRRFVREARSAAEIISPHVVAVVEADTDLASKVPFIVMELLSGVDLDLLIEATGPLDPGATVRIFRQACVGLSAAHARAIVHRDIKPANLFLNTDAGGEVTVKVCDFGIAKRTSTDAINQSTAALTATGGLLGSPIYMSPEQAKNAKNVDARTDIWSLCVSMYQALSGSQPWSHCTTVGELILAICTEELPRLARVAPWVAPELAAVVERGLRRDTAQRWATIDDLYAALGGFNGGSDQIRRDALVAVPLDERWRSVQKAVVDTGGATLAISTPESQLGGSTIDGNTSPARSVTGKRSNKAAWAIGAALGVSVVGVGGSLLMHRNAVTPAASALIGPAAASVEREAVAASAPRKTTAKVGISPPEAIVEVDGVRRPVVEGAVTVEGDPGDMVTIVASVGSARVERRVSILKGGLAEPSSIAVTPVVPTLVAKAPESRKSTSHAAASAPSKPAAAAMPAPAASPKPAATGPKVQTNW